MRLIIAVLLALLLIGVVPIWPHSIHWGYYPSGGAALIFIIFILYILL